VGARRVRRVHPAAGLGYLMPSVVSAVCEQPWCRCMRDADCAWLLMVVVGSRFFRSLACGGLRWLWWAGRWHGLWMSMVRRRHGHDGRWVWLWR
jgi:hypothetical protein